jgi:hypothetical protein
VVTLHDRKKILMTEERTEEEGKGKWKWKIGGNSSRPQEDLEDRGEDRGRRER